MSKSISLHIIGAFAVAVIGFASIATSALAQDSSGYGGDSVHCTIDANPGVTADGATTLIWWSSENVTSATLEGVGEVEPRGWWWTNGIESATTYTMTVTTDDGDTATCEASVSLEEESVEHGFCSEVYPGREIADIDNNGWGDTLSGETGCLIDPVGGADETVECFDYDGDGWGWDGVQGCLIDASEETTDHGYCSDVYPGREIADIDGKMQMVMDGVIQSLMRLDVSLILQTQKKRLLHMHTVAMSTQVARSLISMETINNFC